MNFCQILCQVEDSVSKRYIHDTSVVPHALTSLLSDEELIQHQNSNREFGKLYNDVVKIYTASFESGLRIEPDSFGGFCLFNRTGHTIKLGVIENTVGLLAKVPKNIEIDDWSMMEGEKLMVGIARWANHSCRPNCEYYMSSGYNGRPCVRLRALKEILNGDQLLTFYGPDFFGDSNADCLCGHNDLHGKIESTQETSSTDLTHSSAKKRRNVKPRIKIQKNVSVLDSLIKFYDECSNTSVCSENSESAVLQSFEPQSSDIEVTHLQNFEDSFEISDENTDEDIFESSFVENPGFLSHSSSSGSHQETGDLDFSKEYSAQRLNHVSDVSPANLAASLIALITKYNAPDSLLKDLLKRDQALFGESAISPWAVQTQLQNFSSNYVSRKLIVREGEIILIKFRSLLMEIVVKSINEMLSYSRSRSNTEDIFMPELKVVDGKVSKRLILNTDGALVAKSPISTAWPLFIAVADLPPRKRQAFQNLVLGCLFVGSGYPDFDIFFTHIEEELSVPEYFNFEGQKICVMFKPILFIADLIGKSKVLKMKRCNGFYGCTLCTQRGVHYAGVHRYSHNEKFVMRSFESHMINIQELEKGADDEIRSKSGRKAECEIRTQGVLGKSKIVAVIPNQPLSSPIDPMHQLFLGVAKDLFGHFYDKMPSVQKRDLNHFRSSIKLPRELKNSVRSLDSLNTFKAKELKVFLFYLSPVIFPPFLFGEDRSSDENDLKKIVFATRLLFDTSEHADFCDTLLNDF